MDWRVPLSKRIFTVKPRWGQGLSCCVSVASEPTELIAPHKSYLEVKKHKTKENSLVKMQLGPLRPWKCEDTSLAGWWALATTHWLSPLCSFFVTSSPCHIQSALKRNKSIMSLLAQMHIFRKNKIHTSRCWSFCVSALVVYLGNWMCEEPWEVDNWAARLKLCHHDIIQHVNGRIVELSSVSYSSLLKTQTTFDVNLQLTASRHRVLNDIRDFIVVKSTQLVQCHHKRAELEGT